MKKSDKTRLFRVHSILAGPVTGLPIESPYGVYPVLVRLVSIPGEFLEITITPQESDFAEKVARFAKRYATQEQFPVTIALDHLNEQPGAGRQKRRTSPT